MHNKTVLVTGACLNTGVDIVKLFAGKGWNVVFTGRNADKVKACEIEYKKQFKGVEIFGYAISPLLADGSVDEGAVKAMFSYLDDKGIAINALVLNAADKGLNVKIFDSPLSDLTRVINTNVCWNYCLIEQAGLRMKNLGGGSVVLVNSNTAYRAIPDRVAYVTSKGAQLGMMRALALDLGKFGVRINAVLPGMIKTDRWEKDPEFYSKVPSRFTPIGEVATGLDVAEAVYYLTAHANNTTGAELTVDGGNTIQLYPITKEMQTTPNV